MLSIVMALFPFTDWPADLVPPRRSVRGRLVRVGGVRRTAQGAPVDCRAPWRNSTRSTWWQGQRVPKFHQLKSRAEFLDQVRKMPFEGRPVDAVEQSRVVERDAPFEFDLDQSARRLVGHRLQQFAQAIQRRKSIENGGETGHARKMRETTATDNMRGP